MPKHRNVFTAAEWSALRVLVDHLRRAPHKDRELLRAGMRGIGFYISDFTRSVDRFLSTDLERLLQEGRVTLE